VTVAAHDDPLVPALFAGLRDLGYRETPDYNGERQVGFGRGQFNIAHGRRRDTATCFLIPTLGRGVELIAGAKVRALALSGR
ncbi:GMC family oxidoreductase N-terminal domain-containing protein, partial [Rhizobiaceae sp. 2RAB30]